MPGQILRSCAVCGAGFTPRHARHRHCPAHEQRGNQHRSPTTRTRPSSSTERERIRQLVLTRDPVCQLKVDAGCTVMSTVADHVVAAADGGLYEEANLRGACDHCNSVRGGQHTSALRHGRVDGNAGLPLADGGSRSPRTVGPTRLA